MKMRVIYVAFTSYSISLDRRFFPLADRDESGPGCHRGRCGPPVENCQALKALEARRCLMTCVGTKILTQNINMTDYKTFLYWWWCHHFKCGSFCNHATWFKLTVMLTEKIQTNSSFCLCIQLLLPRCSASHGTGTVLRRAGRFSP